MTVHERLHTVIDELSNEEAGALLARIEDERRDPMPLTAEDIRSVRRGLEQLRNGQGVSEDDVRQRTHT